MSAPKANEAAVAAVQQALGCEEDYGDLEFQANPSYCAEHYDGHGDLVLWTERGCPVAVAAADAAAPHIAAQAWDEGNAAAGHDYINGQRASWAGEPCPEGTRNPYRADRIEDEP